MAICNYDRFIRKIHVLVHEKIMPERVAVIFYADFFLITWANVGGGLN